jgi:folate-binding protein YgfZ
VADDSEIELLRIEHGVPRWGSELTADTLPQEARLEQSSVDFDKGCYVGQEVVSRLRSVGHVNRLLHRFSGSLPAPLDSPVSLLSKDDPSRPAGTLTSAACDFELAQTLALGYLNREFLDAMHFLAVNAAGTVIGELEKRPV